MSILFVADGNRSGRIAGGTKRKHVLSDDVADADAEEAPAEVDAQQTVLEPEAKKAKKEPAIDADQVFREQRAKDSALMLFE